MGLFLLFLLAYPFIELYVLIQVAQAVGVFTALLGVFALSVIGGSVLKRSGLRAWRKVEEEVAGGKDPSARMLDSVIVLIAGLLLVMPGYVTGALGLLLLFPPVRMLMRGTVGRRAKSNGNFTSTTVVYGGPFIDADSIEVSGELLPPEEDK